MEIKTINNSNIEEYNKLSKEVGSIFNYPEWTGMFDNNLFKFGIYEDNKLIGGFYLFLKKISFIKLYRTPPYTPNIGLFYKVKSSNKSNINSLNKNIINLISDFLEKTPYHILSISFSREIIDMQPFIWKKFKVIPNYTYVINYNESIETIKSYLSPERRNDISKAIKDNIKTIEVKDFSIVKNLVLNSFNRKDKKIDTFYLDKILFNFSNPENSFAFISYNGDLPIACAYCIYDKETAYYLLGGYDNKNKHKGAGALCLWEAIQHAKKLNLKYFDFEGSMIKDVERYFRGFGGEIIPYYTVNKAFLPIELALKFLKRERF